MIKKLCKWYIKKDIENEINEKVDKRVNTLLNIENEEFEIDDEVYFYYRNNRPYVAYGRYHKAKIIKIETILESDTELKKFYVEVIDGNFSKYDFYLTNPNISKSLVNLRDKIANSKEFWFVSNSTYNQVNLDDK